MHYVYLLRYKGEQSGKYYIGCTKNLRKRIEEHKDSAGCQTTQNVDDSTQWKLIYYEAYREKSDATRREARLKDYGAARGHLYKRVKDSIDT